MNLQWACPKITNTEEYGMQQDTHSDIGSFGKNNIV